VVNSAMLRQCIVNPGDCTDMRHSVTVKKVDDPESPLHGQMDVVASARIEAGDMGPYSGLVLHDTEIASYIPHPLLLARCLHFWYSLSELEQDFSIFPSLNNPMALVNDFCGPDRTEDRKAQLASPNCRYMAVKVDGWPYIFVVALRAIEPGEALRIDYGDDFW
jgi:hypothetical protein